MPPTAPFSSVIEVRDVWCHSVRVCDKPPTLVFGSKGVIFGETVAQSFVSITQLVTQLTAPGLIAALEAFVHGL